VQNVKEITMNKKLFIAGVLLLALFMTACDSAKFSKVENQTSVAKKYPLAHVL
jgi:hypothetical protein